MARTKGNGRRMLIAGACCLSAVAAHAQHAARDDPPEAIFTERAFVERNLELDADADFDDEDGNELDLALQATWTLADRLQLGLEVPYTVRYPRDEPRESSLSDVAVSTQFVFCCKEASHIAFVAARAQVDAPTGSISKDIGGNGSFEFSLLGDYGVPIVREWDPVSVQVQVTYEQELNTTPDERETAEALDRPAIREKELQWNVAVVQPLFARRFTPVLEVLGTTVVDAIDPDDEGTGVDLGVGFWVAPFDDGPLRGLCFGAGYRFPFTQRRSDDGGVLAKIQWTFD